MQLLSIYEYSVLCILHVLTCFCVFVKDQSEGSENLKSQSLKMVKCDYVCVHVCGWLLCLHVCIFLFKSV